MGIAFVLVAAGILPPGPAAGLASGVPVGGRPGPYSFLVATGPDRGKPTCYICAQEDKPGVVVFARTLSPAAGRLLAQLDAEALRQKDAGLKVWLTHLADVADLDELAKWARTHAVKAAPVGVYEDPDGPPAYRLNPAADVTVLVFAGKKVTANFAFRAGELTDATLASVMAAVGTGKK